MSHVSSVVTHYPTRCDGGHRQQTGSRGSGTEEQTFWTCCKLCEQSVCPAGQTGAALGPTKDPGESQQTGVDQLLSRQTDSLASTGHAVGARAGHSGWGGGG